MDWVNRFEVWCASQSVGKCNELQNEFAWLREIVHHTVPGAYNPGTQVDSLLADLRGLPPQRHDGPTPRNAFPMDTITHLFLGADIAPIPTENLLTIDGITHAQSNRMVRSDSIYPGSLTLVRATPSSSVHGVLLPFLIGVAIETPSTLEHAHDVVVVWYVPGLASAETFRSGPKKKLLDIRAMYDSACVDNCRMPCVHSPLTCCPSSRQLGMHFLFCHQMQHCHTTRWMHCGASMVSMSLDSA